jgi:exodeoxyribonuclease VII small subunit
MAKIPKELTFEEALAKLEAIVAEMEEGRMGLDTMLGKFGEGMDLAKFCSDKLESAEKKVEIIVKKHDGSTSVESFEGPQSDSDEHED